MVIHFSFGLKLLDWGGISEDHVEATLLYIPGEAGQIHAQTIDTVQEEGGSSWRETWWDPWHVKLGMYLHQCSSFMYEYNSDISSEHYLTFHIFEEQQYWVTKRRCDQRPRSLSLWKDRGLHQGPPSEENIPLLFHWFTTCPPIINITVDHCWVTLWLFCSNSSSQINQTVQ